MLPCARTGLIPYHPLLFATVPFLPPCLCPFLSSISKHFERPLFPGLSVNSPAVLPGRRQHVKGAKPGAVLLPQRTKTNRSFWILLADKSCLLMEPHGVRESLTCFNTVSPFLSSSRPVQQYQEDQRRLIKQGAFLELVENKSIFNLVS